MMSKNVVDNFPVFVEFNQTYQLLLVSCLLDQKEKKFVERNILWLDENNWEEWNKTDVLELKEKEMKERKRKTLSFC